MPTEKFILELGTELDNKGLTQLRQELKAATEEMKTHLATLQKGSSEYKVLKASIMETNKVIKMNNNDLKQYANNVLNAEKNTKNLSNHIQVFGRNLHVTKERVGALTYGMGDFIRTAGETDKGVLKASSSLLVYAGWWGVLAAAVIEVTDALVDYQNEISDTIKEQDKMINKISDVTGGREDGALSNYFNRKDKGRTQMFMPDEIRIYAKEILAEEGTLTKEKKASREHKEKEVDAVAQLIKQQETLIGLAKIGEMFDTNSLSSALKELKAGESLIKNDEQRLALKNEIAKVEKDLLDTIKITAEVFTFPRKEIQPYEESESSRIFHQINDDLFNKQNTLVEDSQTVYSNISNILSALNIGTDSWASKVLGVFGAILSITESIKAVNSVLSIFKIPFLASGGPALAGMPHIVGEQGPELFMPKQNGYVFNNQDTMKLINQSLLKGSGGNSSNVWISANVSPKFIDFQIAKRNREINFRRVS